MRLCFVSGLGNSEFMRELLEVVADAARSAGADATVHVGRYPTVDEPCAYVIIPHEYFLTPPETHPTPEQRARTIAFCVEHPGNITFDRTAHQAATLGALMDINAESTIALRALGLPAHRFTLGYSPQWDRWGGDENSERPIDVTYLGTTDERRDHILARQAEQLSALNCRLLIPPHEMMTRPRQDFLMGPAKHRHLAASKILLNLHRGGSRALEWVRVLETMCNGCVIVSESSRDFMPLVPGRHIVIARPDNTMAVATALLRHPERLASIRSQAYEYCRSLDMRSSALRLVELGEWLAGGRAGAPPPLDPEPGPAGTSSRPVDPVLRWAAPGLPELSGEWLTVAAPIREAQSTLIRALLTDRRGAGITSTEAEAEAGHPARVRALMPIGMEGRASRHLTERSIRSQEVGVALSAARPGGGRSLAQPELFSRGALLNDLREVGSEEYLLVIEPGQVLFANGVGRLAAALDDDPGADAAYGFMADDAEGVLWNALPFEPQRLAGRAYLWAPFLVRRQALADLGGFAEDPALIGYEYHEFWRRLGHRGRRAVFVQQIVGRGRPGGVPELSIARVFPELTLAALEASVTGRPEPVHVSSRPRAAVRYY